MHNSGPGIERIKLSFEACNIAQQSHFFLNSAAVGHGLVFATAYLSPLTAYDADTGEIAWTSDLPDVARAAPVLNGSMLIVRRKQRECQSLTAASPSRIFRSAVHRRS